MIRLSEYETVAIPLEKHDITFLIDNYSKLLGIKRMGQDKVELSAKAYVGKIVLPSKKEIYIEPKIKIPNLLYIISYTFEAVHFHHHHFYHLQKDSSLIDLYAKVLLNWVEALFNRGFYKNYQSFCCELPRIRGKIKLSKNFLLAEKCVCEFDEISYSNEINKIIKATLWNIIRWKETENRFVAIKSEQKSFIKC